MGLFDRFRKRKGKRRVAVIGLDGVGAPLVEALTDAGVMPRMAALRRAGTLARMTSTIPTISSVSWSGFMTGANPGRHGIYGFTDVKRDSYAVYFPNYRHVQAPTIWDVLGAEGRRSIVLNIPNTYPAKDINGVLVSGFVAVNIERAVTPASVLPLLKSQGYKIDVDYVNANERVDPFFRDLHDTLAARRRAFGHFSARGGLGLLHRRHHRDRPPAPLLLERLCRPRVAAAPALPRLLRRGRRDDRRARRRAPRRHTALRDRRPRPHADRDRVLPERVAAAAGPPGVQDADAEVHRRPRPVLEAFILDPGRIYLNLKGRFANGVLEPGADAEQLLQRIATGLAAIEYPGAAVNGNRRPVKQVFRRDEIYRGPLLEQAPDAVLHFHDGFDIKGAVARDELFGRSALTGMHTYDDSLLYVNRPGFPTRDVAITDLAPTILATLGARPSQPMDGRVLGA